MNKTRLNKSSLSLAVICSFLCLLTYSAKAQQGWNPNGTTSVGGNGIWDTTTKNWTPNGTETQVASGSLAAWTAGDIALFCAGPSASANQGTFYITNNTANISVSSFINGADNPGACTLTLLGSGSFTVSGTAYIYDAGSACGSTTFEVPINGSGLVEVEGCGATIFTTSNSFTGGLEIGGTGGISFATNSFGTGTIKWLAAGYIEPYGTTTNTVTNAMTHLASTFESFSGNSGGVTFSGPWALGNTGYVGLGNLANTITVSGVISGSAAIVFTNRGGNWTLTGVNTFTGALTNNCTLTIGGAGSLNSGSYAGAIRNQTNFTYKSTASQTLSGALSGSGTLTEAGTGNLTVTSASSTYGGPVTVTGGTLIVGNAGTLSTAGFTKAMTLTSPGIFEWNSSASEVMSGVISGTGALVENAGTLTLSNANTYTGNTTISGGTLKLAYAEVVGTSGPMGKQAANATGTIIMSGGTLQYTSANNVDYSGRFSSTGNSDYNIDVNGQTVTFTNALTNASGELTLKDTAGNGKLILPTTNTYTFGTTINTSTGTLDISTTGSILGNVTLDGGTLELDNASALAPYAILTVPASGGTVYLNFPGTQNVGALYIGTVLQPDGTYGATGSSATYQSATFTGNGILNVNGSAYSYWDPGLTGAIPGSGGNGSWDNSTVDWFTGSDTAWGTNLSAFFEGNSGTVTVNATVNANQLTFATSGYIVNGSSNINLVSVGGVTSTITIPSGTTTINCPISGTAGMIPNGPGTLVLSGTNTYAGITVLTNSGTLSVNNISDTGPSAISTNAVTLGGGTLVYTGSSTSTARAFNGVIGTTSTIDVPPGVSLTINGRVSSTAAWSVNKVDTGTLIISGSAGDNSYFGMTVEAGTVIVDRTGGTGSGIGGPFSVQSGATVQMAGNYVEDFYTGSTTPVTIQNGGTFDLNGTTNTLYSLNLSGSGSGGGVLSNSASASAQLTVPITLAASVTIGGTGNITLTGPITTGGNSLTYAGAGTLFLTANSTNLTGTTTINSGSTITIGGAGIVTNTAFTDNGALIFNGTAANPITQSISGSGTLTQSGSGTTTLSTANYYTGTTTVTAGTLAINAASAYAGPTTITGGTLSIIGSATFPDTLPITNTLGTLNFNSSSESIISQVISGGGALTQTGSGITVLSATNTYTGDTTIVDGTLDGNVTNSIPSDYVIVTGGTLELDTPATMSPDAILTLAASPAANTVNLNFTGTQNVGALYFGTTLQPNGTYGATGSSATYQSATFTGTGILNVSGSAYSYWDPGLSGAATGSGGPGSWNNSTTAWFTGIGDTAWPANSAAYFEGTAGTVTVTAPVVANQLTFTVPGYTLSGSSSLTLDGPTPTVTIPAGNTTIACPIAGGPSGLTAVGPGTLTLSGANTYTGTTVVTNGAILSVNTIADTGTSALSTGNVLLFTNSELSYTGAGSATTTRSITSTGANNTIDVPSGTLTLAGSVGCAAPFAAVNKTSAGTLILGGSVDNSSFGIAVNAGMVIINKASGATVHGIGGNTPSSVASGAELQLSGSGNNDIYSGATLVVSDGGIFDLGGQSDTMSTLTMGGTGSGNGALINSSGTASVLTNGGSGVVLADNTTIGGSGSITLASVVSGGFSLTYAGTGVLTLGGTNGTYSGGTTINAGGTVQLTGGNAAGAGAITINGNGILTVNNGGTGIGNTVTGGSSSVMNCELPAGNLWLTNNLSGFTGTINVAPTVSTAGQLVVGSSSTYTTLINAGAIWNIEAGAVVDFNLSQTNPAPVNLYSNAYNGAANGALRLDNSVQSGNVILNGNSQIGNANAGSSTITGAISDVAPGYGFAKMGAGPLILTGTNTYYGATTISNGMLSLSATGSVSNSSGIQIAPGTSFNVSALNNTFSLAHGQTITNLGTTSSATIAGNVNMGSGSLLLQLTNGITPLLMTNGTLTIANNSVVITVVGTTIAAPGNYLLIQGTNGGVVTGSILSSPLTLTGVAGGLTSSLLLSDGNLYLAVASPSSPPGIQQQLLSQTVFAGASASFSVGVDGIQPITYGWQYNGSPVANTSRIGGANTNILTISNVQLSDAGSYQLFATNINGYTNSAVATLTVLPFAQFTGGAGWTSQGTTYSWLSSSNAIELTADVGNEANSAFFSYPVYVGAFEASFTYQVINPSGSLADGVTFCLQNDPRGAAAVGGAGGSLGYTGITPSVAFEINLYTSAAGGTGVELQTNGVIGTNGGTAPLVFNTGNVISNIVTYNGTTLSVTMTNLTAGTSFTTNKVINIPAALGTNVAYVGFTGGDGSIKATQVVSNFTYIPFIDLSIQPSAVNTNVISWPAGVGAYVLQQALSVDATNWTVVTNTVNLINNQNQVAMPMATNYLFYQLVLP